MPHSIGDAEVNGATLHYQMAGSGHPLVLLHGFSLDNRMWDDQFFVFANKFKVLRYDLRGFGRSAVPTEESYSHVDDLVALMDYLNIPKAHLVGLSIGGRIALDTAITQPMRVASIIPVDTVLDGYQWKTFLVDDIWQAAAEQGVSMAKHLWLNHELFAPALGKPGVAHKLQTIIGEYSGWHFVNSNPWRPLQPRAIEQLHAIISPTKIILGEKDLPDFHTIAEILRSTIPAATVAQIKNAGHLCNMEEPEIFNNAVLDFLSANVK